MFWLNMFNSVLRTYNIFKFSDDWRCSRSHRRHQGPWHSSVQSIKDLFFMTWKISVFYTIFWPEWKWHEKSAFFTPFLAWMKMTWKISVFTPIFWPEWTWKINFFITWKIFAINWNLLCNDDCFFTVQAQYKRCC